MTSPSPSSTIPSTLGPSSVSTFGTTSAFSTAASLSTNATFLPTNATFLPTNATLLPTNASTNASTGCDALVNHHDFTAGSVAAFLSILPNVLLLLTFRLARRRDKAAPMGVVHFKILALLDISYGVVDTLADFPFKKVLGSEVDCSAFEIFVIFMDTATVVVLVLNRYFTAYMTVKRLLAVSSIKSGISFLQKTERRHQRDSILFGLLLPFFLLLVLAVISANVETTVDADVRLDQVWFFATFSLSATTVVVTIVSAGVLMYRRRLSQVSTRSGAEMELLVLLIAVSFAVLHAPFFVLFGEALSVPHDPITGINPITGNVHDICFSVNSAVNFFLFVAANSSFKRTFVGLLRGYSAEDFPADFMNSVTPNRKEEAWQQDKHLIDLVGKRRTGETSLGNGSIEGEEERVDDLK